MVHVVKQRTAGDVLNVCEELYSQQMRLRQRREASLNTWLSHKIRNENMYVEEMKSHSLYTILRREIKIKY